MIYVIGKNGYIASNLIPYLLDKGHEVTGIGNEKYYLFVNDQNKDVVINCASYGVNPGQDSLMSMVESNFYVPYKIQDLNTRSKFIHLSSSSEIFQPHTAYARTKSLASDYLRGKATLCYIYTAWGGVRQHEHTFMTALLKAKRTNQKFTVSTPYATRDFVHVKRICEGIERLLSEPVQEVHFGHGKARKMIDVAMSVLGNSHVLLPEWLKLSKVPVAETNWKADNPYLPDTFQEDLEAELCVL